MSVSPASPEDGSQHRAVFLSYAREDTAAAQRIAEALRAHGVEVWFDQSELRGGDAWDAKIRKQIRECALFMAVISAHTQSRHEGYFRREWKQAVERTHDMAEGVPFILPAVIDDTQDSGAVVPGEFVRVQWTRLPGALPTPQFVEQVKRLLGAPRKLAAAPAPRSQPGLSSPVIGARPHFPAWAYVASGVLLLGLGVYLFVRPPAKEASPAQPQVAAEPKPEPTAAALVSTDKSIAVLPFENMSSDKDNAFFCDGVQEDILTNLANIAELRVVSRTSVEQYRATTKPIRQIAQELGVAWVLEGSVQRDGNKVRVTGQLIDAKTDEHVWAKAYDRDLSDIFAIQSELAETIASSLQAAISPQEKSVVERRPTQNLAAYDLFLKGNDMRNRNTRGTPAWLKEAEQYYAGAVDLDPNFAMAWAELAVVDAYYVFWDFDHTPARLAKADAAIERAVRLAPDDPGVISLLGDYAYHGYRDYARATEQFEKVIQLQPNNSAAIFNLGLVQRRQGRWIESIGNLRKGIELDPGNANYAGNFGSVLAAGRRWNEALAEQRRVVELLPDSLSEQALLAEMDFLASGSTKEADAWLARLTPAQFESPRIIYERKIWAIVKGNYLEWKRLDEAQPYFDEDDTPHWEEARDAALVLAAHGDLAGAKARLADFPTEVRSALQLEPANARLWSGLSVMEAIIGQKERALSDARKAVELIPDTLDAYEGPVFTANLAIVYAWTGDKDRAIDEFVRLVGAPGPASQRNLGMGGFNIYSMRYSAAFTPLHGDPRFEALVDDPKNNAPLF